MGFALLAHCDWSMHHGKRWMSVALAEGDQRWRIEAPEPVLDATTLLARLQARAGGGAAVLVGFDFPIGLPSMYGELTGLGHFKQALATFGQGEWSDWYAVAERTTEISLRRPFYPYRPGGTRRSQLVEGLQVTDWHSLLRECERTTGDRQAACALFWTLGGNQVGKGAISGWRDVLRPDLPSVRLWPFDGTLGDLSKEPGIVVAETYPGDVYVQMGIPRRPAWSKRQQAGRILVAGHLMSWVDTRSVITAPALVSAIEHGFGSSPAGEDQFDSIVGLFGMIDVVDGRRSEGRLDTESVLRWEGWMLGHLP